MSSKSLEHRWADLLGRWHRGEIPHDTSSLLRDNDLLRGDDALLRLKAELDRLMTADPDAAGAIADLIGRVAAWRGGAADAAMASRARAQVAHVHGEYAAAAAGYEAAIAIYDRQGDAESAARVRKTLVDVLMYLGRIDEIWRHADRARADLDELAHRSLLAELDINLGNVHLRLGDRDAARECYERACRGLDPRLEAAFFATATLNLANVLVESFEYDAARSRFTAAAEAFESAGHHALVAEACYGSLYLDLALGRHADALAAAPEVGRRYASCSHPRGEGLVEQVRARAFLELGFPGAAVEAAVRSERFLAHQRHNMERGRALMIAALGLARLGRITEAGEALRTAEQLFDEDGNELLAASARVRHADVLRERGFENEARRGALEALTVFDRADVRREKAYALLTLQRIAAEAADHDGASHHLDAAAALLEELPDPWLRLEILSARARLDLRRDRGDAARSLEAAIDQLVFMRDLAGTSELQMGFLRERGDLFRDLAALRAREGAWSDVARLAETAKSLDLAVGQARGETTETGLPADVARLREELHALYHRQAELDARSSERDRGARARVRDAIRRAERDLMDHARSAGAGASLSLAARGNDLEHEGIKRDGEAVVDFTRTRAGWLVRLHTDRGAARARLLPGAERIGRLLHMLRFIWARDLRGGDDAEEAAAREFLTELGDLLVRPWMGDLGEDVEHLTLVLDGELHGCPFGAITVDGRPLSERFTLSVVPSLGALAASRRAIRPRREGDAVLVAGSSDEAAPQMEREAESVAALWGPRARVVPVAGLASEIGDAGWDVIHVAAHGAIRADAPGLGGMQADETTLDYYDLLGRRLDGQLVVLAGCETSLFDARFGGQMVGLVGAFLKAGAAAVMASLWPVDDAAAADFMVEFHRACARGRSACEAHRLATRAVASRRSHPLHWAPWVVYGSRGVLSGEHPI